VSFLAIIAFAFLIVFVLTAIYRAERRHEGVWRQEEDE
jgi:hypothetical protein